MAVTPAGIHCSPRGRGRGSGASRLAGLSSDGLGHGGCQAHGSLNADAAPAGSPPGSMGTRWPGHPCLGPGWDGHKPSPR